MPVYKLPVLLSRPLGAVLIPIFKRRVRGNKKIIELEVVGNDKEQLNRFKDLQPHKEIAKDENVKNLYRSVMEKMNAH